MRGLAAVLATLALAACAAPVESPGTPTTPPGLLAAEETIGAEVLLRDVEALSDDAMEGRGPGSEGDRKARAYIAERLRGLGYEPGGPGGAWEQPFPLVRLATRAPRVWTFSAGSRALDLRWREDVVAASGVPLSLVRIDDAEVVFVGYGIEAPERGWDDFKGADLRGKVLLVLNNDPDWDPALFGGRRRLHEGRWTYKYEVAARRGAAGAIVLHTDASAGYGWDVVVATWSGPRFDRPSEGGPRLPVRGWISEAAASRLVAAAGRDLADLVASARRREFRPVPLGIRTSLALRCDVEPSASANVLGILRGRDPRLADEAVLFAAHHDHLGIGAPDATGDDVYNGAVDNASGVAQVLAVAGAFASLPERPPRSVVIMAVGAEEHGLLGSLHWSREPTLDPAKVVAALNVDGGNVLGRTRDVVVVDRGTTALEDLLETAAARQGRVVVGEPDPEQGHAYRSDRLTFARLGIPVLHLRPGIELVGRPSGSGRARSEEYGRHRYHRPGDETDPAWDLSGLVEDARLLFEVGLRAASRGPSR